MSEDDKDDDKENDDKETNDKQMKVESDDRNPPNRWLQLGGMDNILRSATVYDTSQGPVLIDLMGD